MFDNLRHFKDFDDLLFEKRNKDYGAYQLRKKYNSVVIISIITTCLIVSAVVILPFVLTKHNNQVLPGNTRMVQVKLQTFEPPPKQIYVPPAPPEPKSSQLQKVVKYLPPVIVDSIKPIENLMPTNDEALAQANVNVPEASGLGSSDEIFPSDSSEGSNQPFFVVEVMPTFKGGGIDKFRQWVQARTVYPPAAIERGIKGRVYLTFIVEKDGSVSNVKVIKGVDPLIDDEAVKAIEQSPKWKPGLQRGHPVRVRYSISLLFSF